MIQYVSKENINSKVVHKLVVFLLIIMSLLASNTLFGQEKFKIIRQNKISKHQLGIDKFYFVHQTFADSFFMTNLYKQLSYDEMAKILSEVYDGVTEEERVNVEFEIETPSDARLAYFFDDHETNGKTFIMLTNFNNAKRAFEPNPDPKDQLARWYYIRGNKLVYRKDLFNKELEVEKRNGEPFEIIDYYLFDDNYENDKDIKPLIDKLLNSNESDINKLYGYLYLSEYYLMNDNLEKSKEAIEDMEKLFEDSEDIPRGYSLIVDMGKAEYEIMKRM